jgi:site-specific recombinase XerC
MALAAGAQATEDLVTAYLATLQTKAPGTLDAYGRVLRQLTTWIAQRPGDAGRFQPDQLTVTALDTYLKDLAAQGTSVSHQTRIKTVVSGFARWLIEDQGLLRRNPARSVTVPPQPLRAPRQLEPDQRYVLRSLVERDGAPRSAALFALGYWAGCRVSDIAWLRLEHTHLTRKAGWLHVGYKGGKIRDIDLHNEARRSLYEYLLHSGPDPASPCVFTSQRYERLAEAGIHHWFRTLKARATKRSGTSSTISPFTLCATTLPTVRVPGTGARKRWPTIGATSRARARPPSRPRSAIPRSVGRTSRAVSRSCLASPAANQEIAHDGGAAHQLF